MSDFWSRNPFPGDVAPSAPGGGEPPARPSDVFLDAIVEVAPPIPPDVRTAATGPESPAPVSTDAGGVSDRHQVVGLLDAAIATSRGRTSVLEGHLTKELGEQTHDLAPPSAAVPTLPDGIEDESIVEHVTSRRARIECGGSVVRLVHSHAVTITVRRTADGPELVDAATRLDAAFTARALVQLTFALETVTRSEQVAPPRDVPVTRCRWADVAPLAEQPYLVEVDLSQHRATMAELVDPAWKGADVFGARSGVRVQPLGSTPGVATSWSSEIDQWLPARPGPTAVETGSVTVTLTDAVLVQPFKLSRLLPIQ